MGGLALAGVATLSPPASAQFYAPFGFYERRPRTPTVSPEDVYFIVRRDGYHRIGRPSFRGDFYVVDATNDDDERVRLLVDGFYGRIIEGRLLGPDAGDAAPPRTRQAARQAGEPDLTVPAPLGGAPVRSPRKAARTPAKIAPAAPPPATASAPPVTPGSARPASSGEAPPVPPAPIPNVPAAPITPPPVANTSPPPQATTPPLATPSSAPTPKEPPPRAAAVTRAKPPAGAAPTGKAAVPAQPSGAAPPPAKAALGSGTQANPRRIDLAPAPQDDAPKAKGATPAPATPAPINAVPVAPLD